MAHSAHAVDELASMASKGEEFNFAYFYCTFGDTASQDPLNILGSFVAQLSESMPSILDTIWPLYEENAKNKAHRHPVDISALEDAIIKATFGEKPIVLLIDAINESSYLEDINRSLLKLSSQSSNIRILVTGTAEVIPDGHATTINMNTSIIRDDIYTFVNYRLEIDDKLRNLSAKLKNEIWQTLVKGADGSLVPDVYHDVSSLTSSQVPLDPAISRKPQYEANSQGNSRSIADIARHTA